MVTFHIKSFVYSTGGLVMKKLAILFAMVPFVLLTVGEGWTRVFMQREKQSIGQAIKQRGGAAALPHDALLFEYGKAVLTSDPANYSNLEFLAQAMRTAPHSEIWYIDGHTCSLGSWENNCDLSWARADAVIRELVNLGVDPGRLRPRGYGEDYPQFSNDTEYTRRFNRRALVMTGGYPEERSDNAIVCDRAWGGGTPSAGYERRRGSGTYGSTRAAAMKRGTYSGNRKAYKFGMGSSAPGVQRAPSSGPQGGYSGNRRGYRETKPGYSGNR